MTKSSRSTGYNKVLDLVTLKEGVDVSKVIPEVWAGLGVVLGIYPSGVTITSGCDYAEGRVKDSLHYVGRALDLRMYARDGERLDGERIQEELREHHHSGWDVVVHKVPGGVLHVHMELDRWPGEKT